VPLVQSALLFALLAAGDPAGVDWAKYEREAVEQLSKYLAIDTSNPPGNEVKAARFLAEILRGAGIEPEIVEVAPNRANLIARLKGDGSKKAVILSNHLDVVGADRSEWRNPPFSGAIIDGEIWGRGALDMKGTAIVQLTVMRALKARRVPLHRDVVFLALADEEDQSIGAEWIRKNRPELVSSAEYLLNEGANAVVHDGKVQYYGVSTTEKTVLWLELRVRGTSGHGSIPIKDGATDRLIAALERLRRAETPVTLLPSVESYFAGLAPRERPELREKMARIKRHLRDPRFMRELTSNSSYNALLRNTVAITGLRAGDKVNVIPGEASATLDCRLLPGTDKRAFLSWLSGVLGDAAIEVRETTYFPTLESPVETELMRVIRGVASKYDPGVPVIAVPLTSTTDSSIFRALGVVAYGFEPFRLTEADLSTQHGANERVSTANIAHGMRFLYDVMLGLAE
jgi:acetylornithine deacetylase/succinyl-diaminopimelate desuccinylase-like protein